MLINKLSEACFMCGGFLRFLNRASVFRSRRYKRLLQVMWVEFTLCFSLSILPLSLSVPFSKPSVKLNSPDKLLQGLKILELINP